MRQSHGQAITSRSNLMPNVNGSLSETVQQTNLRAQGLRISSHFRVSVFPGLWGHSIISICGRG